MAKKNRIVKVHTKELQELLGCTEFNVDEIYKYDDIYEEE